MKITPETIFNEYNESVSFKSSLGNKGIYEQNRINERFYVGDQWYGVKCGNDRPLVRHNIIKRIGDYKMSQITAGGSSVRFSADGVPDVSGIRKEIRSEKQKISSDPDYRFSGVPDGREINLIMSALSDYRNVTAARIGFDVLCGKALKKAYISGSGIIYTYWDSNISTGLYADDTRNIPIKGDINCEVLDIENVCFGDPFLDDVQSQPYIIISSRRDADAVKREAKTFGAGKETLELIGDGDENGKVMVLTKLYKEYKSNGAYIVKCTKSTEKAMVRKEFDTRLTMYPLALFRWEERSNLVYGESEITYLIPNQIAINRMITANVWAAMTMGMPMMVVNGDTVTGDITNDPGQIIKVFGSNEDVAGALKYVTPPDFCSDFGQNINDLIGNTLTQSGANEVALGDSKAENASALSAMRNAATMPLQLVRSRYYGFIEEITRIWADFWISQYGDRRIKIEDENGTWYLPFDANRYEGLYMTAKIDVNDREKYSARETVSFLTGLYEKGVITREQYISRLPYGVIADKDGLIADKDGLIAEKNDGGESGNDRI